MKGYLTGCKNIKTGHSAQVFVNLHYFGMHRHGYILKEHMNNTESAMFYETLAQFSTVYQVNS